jgi:hypothetical protein
MMLPQISEALLSAPASTHDFFTELQCFFLVSFLRVPLVQILAKKKDFAFASSSLKAVSREKNFSKKNGLTN